MKVFISWSGKLSKTVATELKWWVRKVNHDIVPYMSEESIESGQRWAESIASELEASSIGIICVTRGNINKPWLNFEAGALSKIAASRVIPFLYNMKPSDLIKSPLGQFQAEAFTHDDVLSLAKTLNGQCGDRKLEEEELRENFDVFWPQIEERLLALQDVEDLTPDNVEPGRRVGDTEILEEILQLSRDHHKALAELSAADPMEAAMDSLNQRGLVAIPRSELRRLVVGASALRSFVEDQTLFEEPPDEVVRALGPHFGDSLHILTRAAGIGLKGGRRPGNGADLEPVSTKASLRARVRRNTEIPEDTTIDDMGDVPF